MVIVGIDPSLTSTGVAVIDTEDILSIETLTTGEKGHRNDSWIQRHLRIERLAEEVWRETMRTAPDLVVIEAPSMAQRNAAAAHDRAGLWWAIYRHITSDGVPIVPVPPTCRAKYATGKGNASKDAVMLAAAKRYPQSDISGNDEADAVILAAIGARLAGQPIEDTLPQTHLDALRTLTTTTEAA